MLGVRSLCQITKKICMVYFVWRSTNHHYLLCAIYQMLYDMLYVYPTLMHWFNDHPILFNLWFSGRQTYRNFGQWPSHAAAIQHGSALEGGKLHLHHWYWAFLASHYPIFDCLLSSLAQVGGLDGRAPTEVTNLGAVPAGAPGRVEIIL